MLRRPSKPCSEVWDHFTKFINEKGEFKARCNYFDTEYFADPKRNGMTSLKNHLASCRRIFYGCGDGTQTELVLPSKGSGSLGTWTFNQDIIRRGVAEMIIINELPFRFVEGK